MSSEDALGMLRGKDPSEWTVAEVGVWLDAMKLSKFKATFAKESISGEALLYLDEQDLTVLGVVALGERKKLMLYLQRLLGGMNNGWDRSSVHSSSHASETGSQASHQSFQSQQSGFSSVSSTGGTSITFKCSYRRRKKLIKIDAPGSVKELRRAVKKEFGHDMTIKLVDPDGDKFRINKDKDLRTALETYPMPLAVELHKKKKSDSRKTSKMSSVSYAMLDTLVDGCIVIDASGKVVFFNKSAEKIWGYNRSEVVGQNVRMLANDKDAKNHDGYLTRYLSTNDAHIIGKGRKVLGKHKDGHELPLHLAVSENRNGHEITFTGVCKELDSFEGENNNEQIDILDNLLDPAVVIDTSGRIQFFNKTAQRVFGFQITEIVGRNVKILMPYQYRKQHDAFIKNYLTTGDAKVIGKTRDVLAQARDGTIFPVNLSLTETKTATRHTFTGILRLLKDDDESSASEADDDDRETPLDQHRALLESLGVAAVVIDENASVQVYTSAVEKLLGYTSLEVLGRNVKMLTPPTVAAKHDAYVQTYLTTGKSSVIGVGRPVNARHKSGREVRVHLAVSERALHKRQRIFTAILQPVD